MPVRLLDSRTDSLTEILQQLFCQAEHVCCVVAFWGRGSFELFDGMTEEKRRTVRIVCNLTMGGTNPRVIEEFIAEGIQVKHNPTLHSKVYWTDKGVVLGSANASSSGLSLEGREQEGWLEAAIFSDRESETDMTHNYVNDIWCHSEEITDPILKEACKNWRRRRPLPAPDSNLAFMSMLKEGRFSGRKYNIYIALDGGVFPRIRKTQKNKQKSFNINFWNCKEGMYNHGRGGMIFRESNTSSVILVIPGKDSPTWEFGRHCRGFATGRVQLNGITNLPTSSTKVK